MKLELFRAMIIYRMQTKFVIVLHTVVSYFLLSTGQYSNQASLHAVGRVWCPTGHIIVHSVQGLPSQWLGWYQQKQANTHSTNNFQYKKKFRKLENEYRTEQEAPLSLTGQRGRCRNIKWKPQIFGGFASWRPRTFFHQCVILWWILANPTIVQIWSIWFQPLHKY